MDRDLTRKIADVTLHYAKERLYWLEKLAGEPVKSIFPHDITTRSTEHTAIGTTEFEISVPLFDRLETLSTGNEPTLHIILLVAVTVLLGKYSGNRDIIVGVPVYQQRENADFVNTVLPLRLRFTGQSSFKDLLLQARTTLLEGVEHQNYPIEKLAEELFPGGFDLAEGFPLFDVSVLLENIHDIEYLRHIPHHMTFSFLRHSKSIRGRVEYDEASYSAGYVLQMVGHLLHLLEQVLFTLDKPFAEITILSECEKDVLLVDFNNSGTIFPEEQKLHHLFEAQVEKTPHQIAVIGTSDAAWKPAEINPITPIIPILPIIPTTPLSLTYQELNECANRLAHYLIKKGMPPETTVGILLERSVDLIVAILAVLKAGGAYLPISADLPASRKVYMIKDSSLKWLLSRTGLITKEKEMTACLNRENIVMVDEPDSYAATVHNPPTEGDSRQACYIIYTSGTTGNPKGVVLEHRGVVNYISWAAQTYVNGESVAFPFYTGITFDLTVTSIFTPLVTGNTVYVYDGDEREPVLDKILADNRVGVVKLTPAHLKLLGYTPNAGDSTIRRLILGGENLEVRTALEVFNKWQGNIEIYNEYGPTETVVGSMIHRFDPILDTRAAVSIGVPIANTRVYLLDQDLNPVPMGVPGEIYIGGAGVGRGYLNRPELTAEKFILLKNERVFKTGDLAVRYSDGNIQFLGRGDLQVKIRGFRVELAEIEHHLRHFKKQAQTTSILTEKIPQAADLQQVVRCTRCLLTANQPGIHFDSQGVCNVCREYESYADHVKNYFRTQAGLAQLFATHKQPGAKYDCLLLFSGGKDSTYALYRLIDMGLKVLTFTFDNGFISPAAFENIHRTTSLLHVDHITGNAQYMNQVFVESLQSNQSVCHGCWHTLNTYGVAVAHEQGIHLVVSGLSRGQIFEMRLHSLFQNGIFNEHEIEEKLLLFRKSFHGLENKYSRILGKGLTAEMVEQILFVDLFRYDDTPTTRIKEYLTAKGWVQPADTGFCSSNCMINDTGIYMHLKARGIHFYEAPLSWDVRFGVLDREKGIAETTFDAQPEQVHGVLQQIGYYEEATIKDAVVLDKIDGNGNTYLCGYLVSENLLTAAELRRFLAGLLPDYMIPSYFVQVDHIPLAPSGKVDRKALVAAEAKGKRLSATVKFVAPTDEKEVAMATLFKEMLHVERVGVEDNFFELGATSFEIVQVANHLSQEMGREIPVVKLFEYPYIAALLGYLNGANTGSDAREKEVAAKWNETMDKGKSRLAQRRKMRE